ncbi:hypothetical protein GV64_11805 [Endozoicomonas elysicola]|uniref:Uncharacterized protein n=1 Tax=Endozoicomonas elysicola TaxID=305900 RepID=A0A081KB05_9GAMM|nr:hypothetical protein GV64_11805 [Endozoicomonas elysicola]
MSAAFVVSGSLLGYNSWLYGGLIRIIPEVAAYSCVATLDSLDIYHVVVVFSYSVILYGFNV